MELAAVGAPPALLEQASTAIQDEIKHAKLAFKFAGQLLDQPIGPSGLDISNSVVEQPDWADLIRDTFLDGCLGEGMAAAQAAVASKHCDAPYDAAWRCIAAEEGAHAELAWGFVEWSLNESPNLAHALAACVPAARARVETPVERDDREGLMAFGILSRTQEAEIAKREFDLVIQPRVSRLLEPSLDPA